MARPVLDTAHVTTSTGTAAARTFSHTVPSGTSLLIVLLQGWVVGETTTDGGPPSTITWNGASLTRIAPGAGSWWHSQHGLWYLANPTAATANIVVSGGDSSIDDGGVITAVNLSGVDTAVGTSGIRATAISGSAARATITLSPTTSANDLVISCFSQQSDTSTTGQTYGGTSGTQSVLSSVGYRFDAVFLTTSAPTASGQNVTFLGSAASSYPSGLAISIAGASSGTSYNYSATGGVTIGGAALLKRTQAAIAGGGLVTGGSGGLQVSKAISAVGGIIAGGSAALKQSHNTVSSGGIVTGGIAGLQRTQTVAAAGGIVTGGAGSLRRSLAIPAAGGIVTGGAASLQRTRALLASGGFVTGGDSVVSKNSAGHFSITAVGGIVTSGDALLRRTQAINSAGGIVVGGNASLQRSFARAAAGGITTGGVLALRRSFAHLASGGMVTGGVADVLLNGGGLTYVATGGMAFGGAASVSVSVWPSLTALPQGDPAFARLSSVAAMERITPLARVA